MSDNENLFENILSDDEAVEENTERAKKYLAFGSDGLNYAIDADYVNEIIMTDDITRLPKLPDYIRGIINLRGQMVPILDIRLRMGHSKTEFTDDTCIIICTIDEVPFGILVDNVSQMLDIAESQITEPPLGKHQDMVNGIARVNDQVLLLINSEELQFKQNSEA